MAFSLDDLTGSLTQADYNRAPQVNAIGKGTYQIPGLGDYTSQLGGLAGQVPGSPNFQAGTAGTMANQQALQNYLQSVALGQQPTAADVMLQQAQQQAGRQMQSQAVSNQGMNPALGMRQLFQAQATQNAGIAGQSAQQKLQEQQAYSGMAQQGNAQMFQQQMGQMQQQFADTMQGIQAKRDIANNIFSANREQTSFNVEQAQNQQAFEMYKNQQALQAMQDQKRGVSSMIHAGLTAAGTLAGGFLGSAIAPGIGTGLGAMAGGQLLGGLFGGGGGGQNFNPAMMAMLAQRGGGTPGGAAAPGAPADESGQMADDTFDPSSYRG